MERLGTKWPIHHVHVDSVGAGFLHLRYMLAEAGEVGCED
jgi:hypothetical protein